MKFTDEQLSRVLTAHELGGLKRGGAHQTNAYPCCLLQCAGAIMNSFAEDAHSVFGDESLVPTAVWFDANYQTTWTTDEFLDQLTAQGLV